MTTGAIRSLRDPLRGGDPVELGHLDVEHHQVGPQLLGQLDGPLAVAGLADHVVPLLGQHLGEVEADQGLVLGDDDPTSLACWLCVTRLRLSVRCAPHTAAAAGCRGSPAIR